MWRKLTHVVDGRWEHWQANGLQNSILPDKSLKTQTHTVQVHLLSFSFSFSTNLKHWEMISELPLALLYMTWTQLMHFRICGLQPESWANLWYSLNPFFGIFCLFSDLCKVLVFYIQSVYENRRDSWKVTNFLSSFITVRDE